MKNRSKLTGLMALVAFALFAVCVLAVLLTGAKVYRRLVDRGAAGYEQRTAAQYVSARVRQAGDLRVETFGGQDALVLREEIGGETYLTRVYCFDGYIRELFSAEEGNFLPEDGEKIIEAEQLTFALEDSLLTARITLTDGTVQVLTLYLRSGEGVLP